MSYRLVLVAAALMACGPRGASAPNNAESAAISDAWLQARLEAIRAKTHAPAFAGAVMLHGRLIANAAVGVRKQGSPEPVTVDDAFHMGSVTKPLTGTLAAIFVDKGVIRWDTTLASMFPELVATMNPAYREVTVSDLLVHMSGMAYQPHNEPRDEYWSISHDVAARRYEYVKSAVTDPPDVAPRTKQIYSGGTIVVAAMLERLTARTWESLFEQYVAKPVGVTTLRFGASPSPDRIDAPWEHALDNGVITPRPSPAHYDNEPHGPAGRNVFMSVADLARIANAYIDESHTIVSPAAHAVTQVDVLGTGASVTWPVSGEPDTCGVVLGHEGSNGQNWSIAWIAPRKGLVITLAANYYSDEVAAAGRALVEQIVATVHPRCTDAPPPPVAPSLTLGKMATASSVYGPGWGPTRAVDGVGGDRRWATPDDTTSAWLEVDLGGDVVIGRYALYEAFRRVTSFTLSTSTDHRTWTPVATGTTIGKQLEGTFAPVRARYVKLELVGKAVTISELAVYAP